MFKKSKGCWRNVGGDDASWGPVGAADPLRCSSSSDVVADTVLVPAREICGTPMDMIATIKSKVISTFILESFYSSYSDYSDSTKKE